MVFACRHDVVLLQSPTSQCILPIANLQLYAEHKIEGRQCCRPQRAFNTASPCSGSALLDQRSEYRSYRPALPENPTGDNPPNSCRALVGIVPPSGLDGYDMLQQNSDFKYMFEGWEKIGK